MEAEVLEAELVVEKETGLAVLDSANLTVAEDGGTVSTGTLTKQEQKQADERYQEKLKEFHGLERAALGKLLLVQWYKGRFLSDLTQNTRHWGNHTVEGFAEDAGISSSLAYGFLSFYENWSEAQVNKAADLGVSWGNVYYLKSMSDVVQREKLLYRVSPACPEKDRLDSRTLQETIKKLNKKTREKKQANGEKVDNRGGVSASKVMESTVAICNDLIKKLDEFKEAYKEFGRVEDSTRKSAMTARLKAARKALKVTNNKVENILKLIED